MPEESFPITNEGAVPPPLPYEGEDPAAHNIDAAQAPVNYRIEMLPEGAARTPMPARDALPSERPADPAVRARQFVDGFSNGTIKPKIRTNAWDMARKEGSPCFVAHFKVTESAVAELGIPRERFVDGKFQHPGPDERWKLTREEEYPNPDDIADFDARERDAAKLKDLVASEITSDQRQTELEGCYKQQPDKVERIYVDDLAGVEEKETGLETLRQAFDLATTVEGEADGNIRVLNFSTREMTEADIKDIAERLAYYAERTGGAIYDRFDNVVFVPADHPSLKVMVKDKEGNSKQMTRRGYMAPRTLIFSEAVLLPPDEQPESTKEATDFFHSYLRPGEEAEGPDAPLRTLAQKYGFPATIAHEMTHMCLYKRGIPPLKTLYSRSNEHERRAERFAAENLGVEHLVPLTEEELQAFEFEWQWLRNKAASDGRPQGKRFVTAVEHDLTSGPLPRRVRTIPSEFIYKLVPDPVAA